MARESMQYDTASISLNPSVNQLIGLSIPANSLITRVDLEVAFTFLINMTSSVPSAAPSLLYGLQVVVHGAASTTVTQANISSATWFNAGRIIPDAMAHNYIPAGTNSFEHNTFAGRIRWEGSFLTGSFADDFYASLNWEGSGFFGVAAPCVLNSRVYYH